MFKKLLLYFGLSLIALTPLKSQNDWQLEVDKNNVKVYTKYYKDTGLKCFRAESVLKVNYKTLLDVLLDIENMDKWYYSVHSVSIAEKISNTQAIYYIKYDLPFPLKDRVTTIKGKIEKNDDTKKARIETFYTPYKKMPEWTDEVIVDNIWGIWDISYKSKEETAIIHEGFIDPKGNLPHWIINESVTTGPTETLKNLVEYIKSKKK